MENNCKSDVINNLFEQLYRSFCGPSDQESIKDLLEFVSFVEAGVGLFIPYEDVFLASRVQNFLSDKSVETFPIFEDLYETLKKCTSLSERSSLLTFLLILAENGKQPSSLSSFSTTTSGIEISTGGTGNRESEESTKTHTDRMEDYVENVIYSFLGVPGKYMKKDKETGVLTLNEDATKISIPEREMIQRLSKLGSYHNQIKAIVNNNSGQCFYGLMNQGFLHALDSELTNYYGMAAILQDRFRGRPCESAKPNFPAERITLIWLQMWADRPLQRLECLARIADTCKDKKGGELTSIIHSFLGYGDPLINDVALQLLMGACRSLMHMLLKWILDGMIHDPQKEFFVECVQGVTLEELWRNKFRIRTNMLPTFISNDFVKKILATGKSINFLHQVCKDTVSIPGREQLEKCFVNQRESIFSRTPDTELHMAMNTVYKNTSKRVLEVITGQYKLFEHFAAIRQFLLLGEGDFIDYFLQYLDSKLEKSDKGLNRCDLSYAVDNAIRSTNAKYIDPELYSLLDIRLIDSTDSHFRRDVFYFHYNVQGPLRAILQPSMDTYRILFKPLCQTKHITYVLSSTIWQQQMRNARLLRSINPELDLILCRLHLHTSELIHLVQEIQYYVLFEVTECAWTDFQKKVKSMETIDEVLQAHDELLKIIKSGVFLDSKSNTIRELLEDVYKNIYELVAWQTKFFGACFQELYIRGGLTKDRNSLKQFKKEQYKAVGSADCVEQSRKFSLSLKDYRETLENNIKDYKTFLGKLLLTLHSQEDPNLQILGAKIDFNEYYKRNI